MFSLIVDFLPHGRLDQMLDRKHAAELGPQGEISDIHERTNPL